jgi:Zn-finger nucleic acid-binding protein
MQCPIDGTELVMTDRSGVEIDYCPTCRGVWLDRGELDKIIERNSAPPPPPPPSPRQDRHYDDDRPRKKRRESFLSDIFDF